MTDTPTDQFYGYLGRAEVTPELATLRVYPFGFLSDVSKPVFEVLVDRPSFTATDLKGLIHGEIEVVVYSDYVQVDEVLEGLFSKALKGESASAALKSYDLTDYAERLVTLDKYYAQTSAELQTSHRKLARIKSVSSELIRRAELKAHASHEHRLRQAGAIEALQRILAELEMDD